MKIQVVLTKVVKQGTKTFNFEYLSDAVDFAKAHQSRLIDILLNKESILY